jgi:hypothetical protein
LQAVTILHRLLERIEVAIGSERLDRRHFHAIALHGEHEARAGTAPADEHGARTAHAMLAADVGAGEVKLVAQEVGERHARLDLALVCAAVHGCIDCSLVHHCASAGGFRIRFTHPTPRPLQPLLRAPGT